MTTDTRNDILHNAKSQTGSLAPRLGCEERLKNLINIFRRYTAAVIRETQLNMLIFQGSAYHKLPGLFAVGRLYTIFVTPHSSAMFSCRKQGDVSGLNVFS